MGVNKLMLPWGRKSLLEHSLDNLLRSGVKEVVLVLNRQLGKKENWIKDQKIKVVINPYFKRGMSTSIRRGIQASDSKALGILIALGDQPLIKTRTINGLIRAFDQGKGGIILPSYKGRRGHPVIFHKKYKKELLTLRGDIGGRSIIDRHPEDVFLVPVRSKGVIKDIDTWKGYKKLNF